MSYLHPVRLVFYGKFQADVSTVNNDVRHFDNSGFQESYQDFQNNNTGSLNGWFNPTGSGAFRLLDCTVRAAYYLDGSSALSPEADLIVGKAIAGAPDQVSGKIVDLDPQWQLASQLWGLQVRVVDADGLAIIGGKFEPNPFRDLLFSRVAGSGGDRAASAYFQSVLDDVSWSDAARGSRFVGELRQVATTGRLSVRLMTYGYLDDVDQPGFTIGKVSGVIGPYLDDEPHSYVLGRRFAPATGAASWNGVNFCTGSFFATDRLFVDLGNALPLKPDKTLLDIGTLIIGALLNPNAQEGSPVSAASFLSFGEVPYRDANWLETTGGVVSLGLNQTQAATQTNPPPAPLALVSRASGGDAAVIAIRESPNGLFVGVEPFALRIDAGESATVFFRASAFGVPIPFGQVQLGQVGEMSGLGANGPLQPEVPIPVAGIPQGALNFAASAPTNTNGAAVVTITTSNPNNPRGYIDGQLYNIKYNVNGQAASSIAPFEVIAIHLRNAYDVPANPTWKEHIAPIFTQYANLYPIMSQRLVDLKTPASVYEHRKLVRLAFSVDIGDPNYMPVTRDLSKAKQQTILKWLDSLDAGGDPDFIAAATRPASDDRPLLVATAAAERPSGSTGTPKGGKTTFFESLARARAKRDAT